MKFNKTRGQGAFLIWVLPALVIVLVLGLTGCHTAFAPAYSRAEVEQMLKERYLLEFQYVSQKTIQRRPQEIEYTFLVPDRNNLQITATASLQGTGFPGNAPGLFYEKKLQDNYFFELVESKREEITKYELESGLDTYWVKIQPNVQITVKNYAELAAVMDYYRYLCTLLDVEPGTKPEEVLFAEYPYFSVYDKRRESVSLTSVYLGDENSNLQENLEFEYVNRVRDGYFQDDTLTAEVLASIPHRMLSDIYYNGQPVSTDILKEFRYEAESGLYQCSFYLHQTNSYEEGQLNTLERLIAQFCELSVEKPIEVKDSGNGNRMEQTITYSRGKNQYRMVTQYETNQEKNFRAVRNITVEKNGAQIGNYALKSGNGYRVELSTKELEQILGVTIQIDQERARIDFTD